MSINNAKKGVEFDAWLLGLQWTFIENSAPPAQHSTWKYSISIPHKFTTVESINLRYTFIKNWLSLLEPGHNENSSVAYVSDGVGKGCKLVVMNCFWIEFNMRLRQHETCVRWNHFLKKYFFCNRTIYICKGFKKLRENCAFC